MSEAINLVEVYVPGQNCRKILAPMPRPIVDPVLAYIAGWIKIFYKNVFINVNTVGSIG